MLKRRKVLAQRELEERRMAKKRLPQLNKKCEMLAEWLRGKKEK